MNGTKVCHSSWIGYQTCRLLSKVDCNVVLSSIQIYTSRYIQFSRVLKHFGRTKKLTLCQIVDFKNEKILLGYKKSGFGKGNYNGFGGKVEKNETIVEAAIREVKEECGVIANVNQCKKIGLIFFTFTDNLDEIFEVHVYYLDWNQLNHDLNLKNTKNDENKHNSNNNNNNDGMMSQIIETNEMRPEWFTFDKIPLDKMWNDDRYWLKQFALKKEYFIGLARFHVNNVMLTKQFLNVDKNPQDIENMMQNNFESLPLNYQLLLPLQNEAELTQFIDNQIKSGKLKVNDVHTSINDQKINETSNNKTSEIVDEKEKEKEKEKDKDQM